MSKEIRADERNQKCNSENSIYEVQEILHVDNL